MSIDLLSFDSTRPPLIPAEPDTAPHVLPLDRVDGPTYIIDLEILRRNMAIIDRVQRESGCHALLALKGFSTFAAFDTMRPTLAGCCASGLWEARLGREKFGKQVHSYAPAFSPGDMAEIIDHSDHITFNSVHQWATYRGQCSHKPSLKTGLRINPECSTGSVPLYDPCAPQSRLGVKADQLPLPSDPLLQGITGFHSHTLCQQTTQPLEKTIHAIEERFGRWLPRLDWFNFGGGHHITRSDYDVDHLITLLSDFARKWNLQTYIEPGEAHVYGAGYLVATVLDIVDNDISIAILDVSATSHMPDVLEMPYRPPVTGAGLADEKAFTYRFGSSSCLSGDIVGDYSFDRPLHVGDRIVFEDQAQYTMVKTTFFNGIKHPSIATWDTITGDYQVTRDFTYDDFVSRLG